MRITAALKTTALICAAVILGLLSVQGTLALWSKTAASSAQTVSTADFAVLVTPAGGVQQRLASGGTVALPPVTGLMRGASTTTAIHVTNAANAGSGTFTVRATAGPVQVTGTLAPYLTTSVTRAQGTDCTVTQSLQTLDLAQGASGTLCLTTALAADAPATVGGAPASAALTLNTAQL